MPTVSIDWPCDFFTVNAAAVRIGYWVRIYSTRHRRLLSFSTSCSILVLCIWRVLSIGIGHPGSFRSWRSRCRWGVIKNIDWAFLIPRLSRSMQLSCRSCKRRNWWHRKQMRIVIYVYTGSSRDVRLENRALENINILAEQLGSSLVYSKILNWVYKPQY